MVGITTDARRVVEESVRLRLFVYDGRVEWEDVAFALGFILG